MLDKVKRQFARLQGIQFPYMRIYRKIIYKSLDNILSEKEEMMLKKKLSSSMRLRKEKYKIERLRFMLVAYQSGTFKPDFETSLLRKINQVKYQLDKFYKEIKYAFKRFVYAALLMIAFLILFNIEEEGEIKILNKNQVKIGEALNSEYFYSVWEYTTTNEKLNGDNYGL